MRGAQLFIYMCSHCWVAIPDDLSEGPASPVQIAIIANRPLRESTTQIRETLESAC